MRSLLLIGALATLAACASAHSEPPPAPTVSTIYAARDETAVVRYVENEAITKRMTDSLVLAMTGEKTLERAWRKLLKPEDKLGIKVAAVGGRYFSSHQGIVKAIVAGAALAGIPPSSVIVWDRSRLDLQRAGFVEKKGGYQVRGIDIPAGFNPENPVIASLMGKLIWGDLRFNGKSGLGWSIIDKDQVSMESHLSFILSRDVTRVVNVALLADAPGCGMGGAVYNLTVPNLDNNRRFLQPDGGAALVDAFADPRLSQKVAFHIVDGLVGQFAGGPAFDPNSSYKHDTIYASRDPIALDSHGTRLITAWRKSAKLPPIDHAMQWLEMAEERGLGHAAEDKIVVREVTPRP